MIKNRKASTFLICLIYLWGSAGLISAAEEAVTAEKPAGEKEKGSESVEKEQPKETPAPEKAPEKTDEKPNEEVVEKHNEPKAAVEDEVAVAVARPVSSDPVQVYGWREYVEVSDGKLKQQMKAKLDTGALTSSIHVEEKELFERDGKKWVRFIVTDPGDENSKRLRIEAPLIRIARIKEPGGESEAREVVRLSFLIGDRKLKADFTLNNRVNMLSPVLIGRRTIKVLGWVDPSRAYLADKKVMR
ncbi:ATP-dependent zinc protease [Haloferula sp.]|uniref:ATP-dependent zinc protease family protein n=1 Tax=Haloferula sp. TaxID=2497595 RepID=UPI0032A0A717